MQHRQMLRITVFKLLATPRPIMLGPRMFRIPSLPRYSTSNASGINESPTADSSDADISEGSATACNTIKDEVRDSEKYRELHVSPFVILLPNLAFLFDRSCRYGKLTRPNQKRG